MLWLWHFLYSVGPHPVSSPHIYTFVVSRAFMAGAASQAGDADSSRAPGLTSGLQGSVNVHRGALLLVPQWQCISSFVFYIVIQYLIPYIHSLKIQYSSVIRYTFLAPEIDRSCYLYNGILQPGLQTKSDFSPNWVSLTWVSISNHNGNPQRFIKYMPNMNTQSLTVRELWPMFKIRS